MYPGFAAAQVLFADDGSVRGVAIGDMGVGKNGEKTDSYMPGMDLLAKQTIFAEGCRGHLTKGLFETYELREGKDPQTFAIGIKELWDIALKNQSLALYGILLAGHFQRIHTADHFCII